MPHLTAMVNVTDPSMIGIPTSLIAPSNGAVYQYRLLPEEDGNWEERLAGYSFAKREPYLRLVHGPIPGKYLSIIGRMKAIEELNLACFEITDNDLAGVHGLEAMRVIDLSGQPVTGSGLAHLKGLPKLTTLVLTDTHVSDNDVGVLRAFPRLTDVSVEHSHVSPKGVTEWEDQLPRIKVAWGPRRGLKAGEHQECAVCQAMRAQLEALNPIATTAKNYIPPPPTEARENAEILLFEGPDTPVSD
jgi:hypothetical protein